MLFNQALIPLEDSESQFFFQQVWLDPTILSGKIILHYNPIISPIIKSAQQFPLHFFVVLFELELAFRFLRLALRLLILSRLAKQPHVLYTR